MADIFISYANVDRPFARRLADALEARGWSVWWDHRSLHGGQHFDRVIEEAIHGATVVIVVWSEASVESEWVRDEAMLALEERKLVPLRIDRVRLPLRFRNIHTIDLATWAGETEAEPFERLEEDLKYYLGPSNKSEHPGTPTEPSPRLVNDIALRIWKIGGILQRMLNSVWLCALWLLKSIVWRFCNASRVQLGTLLLAVLMGGTIIWISTPSISTPDCTFLDWINNGRFRCSR